MPDLSLPYPVDDSPHNPEQEYSVEVGEVTLRVHFDKHTAFVRMANGDFLDALPYAQKHIKPSLRDGFLRSLWYLKREYDID